MRRKQNDDCNARNFRWLLFGMSPDVALKVRVLTSDSKFELT